MAVVLVKAYERKSGQPGSRQSYAAFADANSISAWALEDVQTAQELGLLQGRERNQFAPKAAVNRAEGAQAIWQLLQ
ncbi:S-layer homology domain-containing protein [Xylanibacillus composti]|nr:S-layer homology domain-containing protein [Xylanibacillus composti]